jgi:hypothetical protein
MMDAEGQARVLTRHLWDESSNSWKALAAALRERGIDPQQTAVGDRFSDDGDKHFGVLVTRGGEECSFVMQFLGKGRVAVEVQPLTDPGVYEEALDAAQSVLDSVTE